MKIFIVLLILCFVLLLTTKQNTQKHPQIENPCVLTSQGLECKTQPDYIVISHKQALAMCEEFNMEYDYEAIGLHPMDFCN